MKNIVLLGSTGSIGTQTLDVVRHYKDDIQVTALAAASNIEKLEEQIREFKPKLAVVFREDKAKELRQKIRDLSVEVLAGMDGLLTAAVEPSVDIVLTAVVGMIGIRPTIAAVEAGKDIALANKETLVTAGHLIMPLAKEKNVKILPVDSEHSAIFQSLHGENRGQIHKILLTASGGPFRGKSLKDLENIRVEDALKHPNWVMGRKITIDSATMVNKGLEVIEARWLFDVGLDRIQVVVHPESVLHSAVEFEDSAVIGQMGTPDMRLPIQYALFYPDRKPLGGEWLDLFKLGTLHFEAPDLEVFKGLKLAYKALETGGSMTTVFNAANERAVAKFLDRKIRFLDIPEIIREAMEKHTAIKNPSLEEILDTEKAAYEFIESRW